MTAWILTAIPVTPTQPPGTQGLNTIINYGAWACAAICVVAMLIAGAMLAIEHHRGMGGGDSASRAGKVLVGAAIVASASAVVGSITGV